MMKILTQRYWYNIIYSLKFTLKKINKLFSHRSTFIGYVLYSSSIGADRQKL